MNIARIPPRLLAIDASSLIFSGGGATHLQELLLHADWSPFSEIVVLGAAGQENLFADLHPRVRFYCDPELPLHVHRPWRSLGYWLAILQILYWRANTLPRRVAELDAGMLLSCTGLLPARMPRSVKTIAVMHNMLPFDPVAIRTFGLAMRVRFRILRRQQIKSMHRAAGVIFLSHFARDVLMAEAKLPAAKVTTIIPNGSDHTGKTDTIRRKLKSPVEILYVSGLDPYKHHDEVIAALGLLRKDGRNIRLHLAGPEHPAIAAQLRAQIGSLGLESSVVMHGALAADALKQLYRRADLFVFASSCENCPTVLLEAMAHGLPIVAAKHPAMMELAHDAMVPLASVSADEIAAAVNRLLSDEMLRRRLSEAGRRRAGHLTWERAAEHTYGFLASLGAFNRVQRGGAFHTMDLARTRF